MAAVRQLAQWLTGDVASRNSAIQCLVSNLSSEDPAVKEAALGAIAECGDIRRLADVVLLMDDAEISVRVSAAQAACMLVGWPKPEPVFLADRQPLVDRVKEEIKPAVDALGQVETALRARPSFR